MSRFYIVVNYYHTYKAILGQLQIAVISWIKLVLEGVL